MELPSSLIGVAITIACLIGFYVVRTRKNALLKKLSEQAREAFARQNYVEAERLLRRCVNMVPLWTHARSALGEALARQGKLEEAAENYRLAADLQPRNAAGYLDLGLFYAVYAPAERDKAIESLGRATELAPELKRELMHDYRLTYLREDPRFLRLVE